ncbi:helix-turn-helix protein [Stackebrandtia endophytica]|uniref:Helix-turn-helix protein n=1 Tax=Stackebrandtia endophytica TaxID=1496996 RepID=A0A543AY74_9ACTN|nr:helix-turn-helix transcriptional regulator [Stackebrandtia endophytica]TQL77527.1 helix-turn-helix protein [Stackebrandtia endophytica]
MAEREATLRAAWLGTALAELREQAGLTMRQFGKACSRHAGTISRIESGIQPAKENDVLNYLRICNVTDTDRQARLLHVAAEVNDRGWWEGYKGSVSGTLIDRLWLEERATAISSFETLMIPGLLQSPEYAESIIRLENPEASDVQLRRWLKVRMTRQHILTNHNPSTLTSIIDESVLRRPVGGDDVMRSQLDHLLTLGNNSHIRIHILRNSAGYCGAGAYVVLHLIEPFPVVAYTQTPLGDVCVEGSDAESLEVRYSSVLGKALNAEQSYKVIAEARSTYE